MPFPASLTAFSPRRQIILSVAVLVLLWLLLRVFTLGWDLPAMAEHAPDCAPPQPSLSAYDMMQGDTFKYPPLQYLIYAAFAPSLSNTSDVPSPREILSVTSARIFVFRVINSLMELVVILLTFFAGILFLNLSPFPSASAAALLCMLQPFIFYSHTSNMDIPCACWLTAAVFTAAFAERLSRHHSSSHWKIFSLDFLCGTFIAFAFCTKDQSYGYLVLPAFALVILRKRRGMNLLSACSPLFRWGVSFILFTCLIYLIQSGFSHPLELARCHFSWITGSGKNDFMAYGSSLPQRLILFFAGLSHLAQAAGYALLLLLAFSLWLLNRAHRFRHFSSSPAAHLFFWLAVSFCSAELLLFQTLRNSHIRYMIPFLPWLCLGSVLLLAQASKKRFFLFFLPFFLLQSASSAQTLYNLRHSVASKTRDFAVSYHLGETVSAASMTASAGQLFSYTPEAPVSRDVLKSWQASQFVFHDLHILDIPPDSFFLRLFSPDVLFVSTARFSSDNSIPSLLQSSGYSLETVISPDTVIPQSWHFPQESQMVFVLSAAPRPLIADDFRHRPLSAQMMVLEFIFTQITPMDDMLRQLGGELAPVSSESLSGIVYFDFRTVNLMIQAYTLAGRTSDASALNALFEEKKLLPNQMIDPQ